MLFLVYLLDLELQDDLMDFDDIFDSVENTSFEQILNELLSVEDIELKTEIIDPVALTRMKAYSDYWRSIGLTKTADFLDGFIQKYLLYMVSYKRQRAQEIVGAVSALVDKTKKSDLADRLLGRDIE